MSEQTLGWNWLGRTVPVILALMVVGAAMAFAFS